jgi:hypothetical protein
MLLVNWSALGQVRRQKVINILVCLNLFFKDFYVHILKATNLVCQIKFLISWQYLNLLQLILDYSFYILYFLHKLFLTWDMIFVILTT